MPSSAFPDRNKGREGFFNPMSHLTFILSLLILGSGAVLFSCGGGSGTSGESRAIPPETMETGSMITMEDGHGTSYKITSATTLETGDEIFSGTYTYMANAASAQFSMTLTDGKERPGTIASAGEMTFSSSTEGYYNVTRYESSVISPAGLSGPFKITK